MKQDINIEKYELFKIEDLSEEKFLYDFLAKAYENNIIDDKFMEIVYSKRLKSLQTMLKYYTKNESSSILKDDAERILESIDYTISIYLKRCNSIDDIINKIKNESFEEMISAGNKIIKINVRYCKDLLEKIQKNKLAVKNLSYHDTIDRGFAVFFTAYDDFFEAHIAPCSVDYIVSVNVENYAGVEYVKKYFEALYMENEFCNNFNIEDINKLLKSYAEDCELLLINVFDMVLTNCIGLAICNSDIKKVNISSFELKMIKEKLKGLSFIDMESLLNKSAEKCIEKMRISNEELIKYIKNAVIKIASSIYDAVKINTLNKTFIEFKEDEEEKIIEFIDKEKLTNKAFRIVTNKIRESNTLEEKLEIINNNIKSIEDLYDMLESECLFDEEYDEFFRTLPNMKIILLLKYIEEFGKENEWADKFKMYLDAFSKDDIKYINEIKNKIVLS